MQNHQRLDNFRIIESLGEGGVSKVKLAEDLSTHQIFALKILKDTQNNDSL